MDFQISDRTQEYRLLMIQPDPENGERICVGIVFQDDVVYDAQFPRLKCISQGFDTSVARFYLGEIRQRIRESRDASIQQVLAVYAPIFSFSAPRRVANPVTEVTKATLLRRFVTPLATQKIGQNSKSTEVPSERRVFSSKLREITSRYLEKRYDHVIENAKASDVLGRAHPGIGKVALALKRLDKTLVMDGVDLHSASPQKAITQSARVVHTFWQYKRASAQNITRVAILFNGVSPGGPIEHDAHDFVLEQFRSESDKTIDGSSLDISSQVYDLIGA